MNFIFVDRVLGVVLYVNESKWVQIMGEEGNSQEGQVFISPPSYVPQLGRITPLPSTFSSFQRPKGR